MNHINIRKTRRKSIVLNIVVSVLLLGAVIFIGVCPPIGILCIALVLFS